MSLPLIPNSVLQVAQNCGVTFDECIAALSIISVTSDLKRPIKTKDNKRILLTINEGLEIYRTYGKNICDLLKKEVEEYLMVIRL